MSSARLTIPISGRSIIDPWWIRLEQDVIEDDSASLADAATLLDTLYNLDPCDDGTTETAADPDSATTDETVEAEVRSIVCQYDENGNIDVDLMVYRSSPAEDYTLALQGGAIKTVETVTATITKNIRIENAASITLDAPVLGNFSASWSGTVYGSSGAITPTITRVGNTIDFGGIAVKAGTIRISYATEYDRCTVTVLGVDGEPGECTARAFYHGLVDELEVEVPEPSEELGSCRTRWAVPSTPHKVECYRTVWVSKTCQCSHDEIDHYTYDEVVDCPDEDIRCPGALTECRHFLGTVVAHEYVSCPDDYVEAVSSPAYYERVCCKTPDFALPQCKERITSWKGGLPLEGGVQQYYDLYGPDLEIVPVSPPGGICGTWTIKQEVVSGNCCDGVEALSWDTAVSPEVQVPNSAVIIGVQGGGKYPYRWTVFGHGFQFQNGAKSIETTGNQVRLSALTLACGTARITVTDGCTTVSEYIRCTSGKWALINQGFWPDFLVDEDGLFLCSSSGGGYAPGYTSVLSGRWYVGAFGDVPPTISPLYFERTSHILGLWASEHNASPVMVAAPGTDGEIMIPALVSPGTGSCVRADGGGSAVGVYQYWFAPYMQVWEWVCL